MIRSTLVENFLEKLFLFIKAERYPFVNVQLLCNSQACIAYQQSDFHVCD